MSFGFWDGGLSVIGFLVNIPEHTQSKPSLSMAPRDLSRPHRLGTTFCIGPLNRGPVGAVMQRWAMMGPTCGKLLSSYKHHVQEALLDCLNSQRFP